MELALAKAKKQRDSMIGFCHKQAEEFKSYAQSFTGQVVGVANDDHGDSKNVTCINPLEK
jgi:hypothetical protein